jgi:EF hand
MNGSFAARWSDATSMLGAAILVVALGACRGPRSGVDVSGTYDADGKLRLLTYDTNGDGRPDTWAYMDGTKVVRVEIDKNEDGVIERREYYDTSQRLEKVELSTRKDGKVTRTEFYDAGVLVRAEQDVDGNGAVDRWETYTDGHMGSVGFDLEQAGRPTLRLVYGSHGEVVRVETAGDLAPHAAKR